ncbi:MAG: hypothetical protein Q7R35_06780 [Elusimicrobiota bacterium]|nr:hypothetical protein [Elusimicrobiota bacterium]
MLDCNILVINPGSTSDCVALEKYILTGGLAHGKLVAPEIKRRVGWIAQVLSYPGGDEMTALRRSAELALRHPATVKKYGPAVPG